MELFFSFNAKYCCFSKRSRVLMFYQFCYDTNITPVNVTVTCKGEQNSYVSYDGKDQTLIDFICIPIELLDCVHYCEILVDDRLNVSCNRPVLCI